MGWFPMLFEANMSSSEVSSAWIPALYGALGFSRRILRANPRR